MSFIKLCQIIFNPFEPFEFLSNNESRIITLYLLFCDSTESVNIECLFKDSEWTSIGNVYTCELKNDVIMDTQESAVIDSVSGTHRERKINDYVMAFNSKQKGTISFFPRGLDKVFINLVGFLFYTTDIKEIHQSDLKPFHYLEMLSMYENQIEVLEDGLFEFNPRLQFILFSHTRLTHIDPHVFDNLPKLTNLRLEKNPCIDLMAEDSAEKVHSILEQSKRLCRNRMKSKKVSEVENTSMDVMMKKIENVEAELKNVQTDINAKISNLEKKLLAEITSLINVLTKINQV